jgi:hypothetical protein
MNNGHVYVGRNHEGDVPGAVFRNGWLGNPMMQEVCLVCESKHSEVKDSLDCFETYLRVRMRQEEAFRKAVVGIVRGNNVPVPSGETALHARVIARLGTDFEDYDRAGPALRYGDFWEEHKTSQFQPEAYYEDWDDRWLNTLFLIEGVALQQAVVEKGEGRRRDESEERIESQGGTAERGTAERGPLQRGPLQREGREHRRPGRERETGKVPPGRTDEATKRFPGMEKRMLEMVRKESDMFGRYGLVVSPGWPQKNIGLFQGRDEDGLRKDLLKRSINQLQAWIEKVGEAVTVNIAFPDVGDQNTAQDATQDEAQEAAEDLGDRGNQPNKTTSLTSKDVWEILMDLPGNVQVWRRTEIERGADHTAGQSRTDKNGGSGPNDRSAQTKEETHQRREAA